MTQLKLSSQTLRWRWGAACSMPRCLTLMTPVAYRPIICFSRTASCKSCASGRLQPCYRLWRSTIRRGEGTLAGSAQIHVASIQTMQFLDS